jgi:hypothetical protein
MMSDFTDGLGRVWHPQFTTKIMRKAGRMAGLTISELFQWQALRADQVLDMLWYMCEDEARERKMSLDDFNETVCIPRNVPELVTCAIETIAASFPKPVETPEGASESENPPSAANASGQTAS